MTGMQSTIRLLGSFKNLCRMGQSGFPYLNSLYPWVVFASSASSPQYRAWKEFKFESMEISEMRPLRLLDHCAFLVFAI